MQVKLKMYSRGYTSNCFLTTKAAARFLAPGIKKPAKFTV